MSQPSINLKLCAICKTKRDRNGLTQTSASEDNCKLISDGSVKLDDGILDGFSENERTQFKYHPSCFRTYKLKIQRNDRKKRHTDKDSQGTISKESNDDNVVQSRPKRKKSTSIPKGLPEMKEKGLTKKKEKPCIICNFFKHKGDNNRWRLCEATSISLFLQAKKFRNDDVHIRTIFLETHEHVTAEDILSQKLHGDIYSAVSKERKRIVGLRRSS